MNTDDRLDRIDQKLEDLHVTLVRNTATVEEHEKRSTSLEARVIPLENQAVIFSALGKITLALLSSGLAYELIKLARH